MPLLARAQGAESPAAMESTESLPWNFGASLSLLLFPYQPNYLNPVLTLDHSLLHVEARYNYEALHTGSLWMGLNFSLGQEVQLLLTPMVGGVFGAQAGIALTLEWTLTWKFLSWFAEPELVLDFLDSSKNNINGWSQFTAQPISWFQFGLALQRLHAHSEPEYVAWGPFIGFTVWKLTLSGYWFNPGSSSQHYWMVTLALTGLRL